MKLPQSAWLAGIFTALASAAILPRDDEPSDSVLTPGDVADFPVLGFGDFDNNPSSGKRSTASHCKYIPGDSQWPSNSEWSVLNFFTGGSLVKPDPVGKVCYKGSAYDAARCANVTAEWSNSDLHAGHPTSIMSPLYQGLTCLPQDSSFANHQCTLGGYPIYVVNARNAWDVQAGVNFARNTNIRLVIKNTGHDFAGKSSGSYSLSIRTHMLKDIAVIKNYKSKYYSGPAIKAGSGIQGFELYAAAHAAGLMAVGGEGMTVGWGGGYIQGGGHSPLSSLHGMAADQVLSYEVVLANGCFVTADKDTNSDLFWALRGGGGSAFGVVISITVKAFTERPVTISTFNFTASAADVAKYDSGDYSNDDFWAVIKHYLSLFPEHADQGIYSYWNIFPSYTVKGAQTFTMQPYFAVGKTVAQVNALLQSLVDTASAHGITIHPNTVHYPSFYEGWKAGFPKETVGLYTSQPGSRLFPRANWANDTWDTTFDAIRQVVSASFMIGFNIAPSLTAGGVTEDENAVNPAWRNTVLHAIAGVMWDASIRNFTLIREYQRNFTHGPMQLWRDLTPGSGAYLGEADINEPDWQQAFYGCKYSKLYSIKKKYDLSGVFFAETAVGSEDWKAGNDRLGRLCRV
ncbi:hypothetical protein FN846DRAFT_938100 [Sphaerosporella brunnea]|uniref:FAD-binding PCMH-type domain-containing protein n=1 Tax=Sphaerosporella brunnea TaxID=1250544 RepID=A0A5J5F403_9PEZI|nr:hypothetical protein FN846DRAFT_938100 [Sphaerosporella brunnea]